MEILNDMVLFVEVAKLKGFRSAGESLGIPNSTVSRRMNQLEKAIGLRLLHRTTRKIELTEAGRLYFERCQRIVDEAKLAHQELGSMLTEPCGLIRASLPVDFASNYLAPIFAKFAQLNPKISFELDLSPRNVDLIAEPYDIAIRMGTPPNSNLIARQIASLESQLFASPNYLKKFGQPSRPEDLVNYECLGLNLKADARWTLSKDGDSIEFPVHGRFHVNSVSMIKKLVTYEAGIGLLPAGIAAEDVLSGKLVRVLPQWEGPVISAYALTETRLLPTKIQRLLDFLKTELALN